MMTSFPQDLRYAVRILFKNRGFVSRLNRREHRPEPGARGDRTRRGSLGDPL